MHRLRQIRLAALNIDGVLLNDTFSPVIHRFVTEHGGRYDVGVEQEIFSQPQLDASRALGAAAGLDWPAEKVRKAYFELRETYLEDHPVRLLGGVEDLLLRLRSLGVSAVCYGGLSRPHFDQHLGRFAELFAGPKYVCTNDFRPGVREITTHVFGLAFDQAVFVDDVARVAQEAQELGAAFIGHPSDFAHGFQRPLMQALGVRHLVFSLDAITHDLLHTIDRESASRTTWAG